MRPWHWPSVTAAPRLADDPIFAAIEAHRAACGAVAAVREEHAAYYEKHGEYLAPNKNSIEHNKRVLDEQWEAFTELRFTTPTTRDGIVALLTYASEKNGIEIWRTEGTLELLRTLQAAVAAGAAR
jgi:hypothetical protein